MGRMEKLKGLFRSGPSQVRQQHDNRHAADRQAIEAMQGGNTGVFDRSGRQLQMQDDVLYDPPFDLIFKVMGAAPVLDRNAPRGLIQLMLVCTVPVNAQGGMPSPNLTLMARHGRWLVPEAPAAAPAAPPDPLSSIVKLTDA